MTTVTISGSLIKYIRKLFRDGILDFVNRRKVINLDNSKNGYSDLALPAYITAVASVEAFTNETYLSPFARSILKKSSLFTLRTKWLKEVDLREKIVIIAKLLCGTTLQRGEQPFQDFSTLVRVRNAIVHYKMDDKKPSFVLELNQKKIGLDTRPPAGSNGHFDQPWVWDVSSTEGIRWAHNTAASMMKHLIEMMPQSQEEYQRRGMEKEIPHKQFKSFQEMVYRWLGDLELIDEVERNRIWAEALKGV